CNLPEERDGEHAQCECEIEALEEVGLEADGYKEDRRENVGDELVENGSCLCSHVRRIADGDADQEGAKYGMDADGLCCGGAGEGQHEREPEHASGPTQARLDPGQRLVDEPSTDR